MVTLQFRVRNGDVVSVRARGWTGDAANVMENGLRSQLSAYPRRGASYQLSVDEAKSFISSLVVFAAAWPQALQLNGVRALMALDGRGALPRTANRPPVRIDLWAEKENACAQVVEGRWFEEDLRAASPVGGAPDADGVWRVPLGPRAYYLMVFLGLIRACYPETFQIRGMQGLLEGMEARRTVLQ